MVRVMDSSHPCGLWYWLSLLIVMVVVVVVGEYEDFSTLVQ